MEELLRSQAEPYIKAIAEQAAKATGAAREADIRAAAQGAAKAAILPYAGIAAGLAGLSVLLGGLALFRALR